MLTHPLHYVIVQIVSPPCKVIEDVEDQQAIIGMKFSQLMGEQWYCNCLNFDLWIIISQFFESIADHTRQIAIALNTTGQSANMIHKRPITCCRKGAQSCMDVAQLFDMLCNWLLAPALAITVTEFTTLYALMLNVCCIHYCQDEYSVDINTVIVILWWQMCLQCFRYPLDYVSSQCL